MGKCLRTTYFFQLLQKSLSSKGGVIISNLDVSGTNGQMNHKVSRLLQGYSAVFGHENMSELDLGASKVVLVVVDGGSDKDGNDDGDGYLDKCNYNA